MIRECFTKSTRLRNTSFRIAEMFNYISYNSPQETLYFNCVGNYRDGKGA